MAPLIPNSFACVNENLIVKNFGLKGCNMNSVKPAAIPLHPKWTVSVFTWLVPVVGGVVTERLAAEKVVALQVTTHCLQKAQHEESAGGRR